MSAQNSDTGNAVSLLFCAILAVGFHAGILYAWKYQPKEAGLIQVLGDSVEVTLVESSSISPETVSEEASAPSVTRPELPTTPPPAEPPPVKQPTPEPVSVPAAPVPVPLPDAAPTPREESPPSPPREIPPPAQKPRPLVATAKPPPLGKPAEGISTKGSTVGTVGDASGKLIGKPLYLVRPQVNYPSESRAAGEQGVVLLRITVNANGRPSAVSVATSSGFPRLDRAAVEGGWRCKVSNAFEGAQFEAPLRFSLQDR